MFRLRFLAAIGALAVSTSAFAETLGNGDIVALLQAGLGEEAVIAKIETGDGDYQTDVETLLALRDQGVPSPVIAAMVKKASELPELSDSSPDSLVPHYAGVYLMDDWSVEPRMLKIDATASTQTKTGGILGYAITGGLASASVKAVIPGEEARHISPDETPTFYLYLDSSAGNSPGTLSGGFGPALMSPNEMSLMKLKSKKGRREARIGSMNIAGAKTGVMDKDQIPFSYEQVAPGVYRMTIEEPLKDGQYGFVFAISGGAGPGLNGTAGGARVFAFGVDDE
ncbi:MAG: hypothetical protein AAGK02_05350 [Pseudomonadota bacterium]